MNTTIDFSIDKDGVEWRGDMTETEIIKSFVQYWNVTHDRFDHIDENEVSIKGVFVEK